MCLAVPGQIQEIYESLGTRMGKVSFGGIVKEVCLAYLPEIAVGVGIVIEERSLPILPDVQSACDLLDMDLIYAPNEGKLVAIVDPRSANEVLRVMQEPVRHPGGYHRNGDGEVRPDACCTDRHRRHARHSSTDRRANPKDLLIDRLAVLEEG